METGVDYEKRQYLSVGEVASFTGLSVAEIHKRVRSGEIPAFRSGSGQYRFNLEEVRKSLLLSSNQTKSSSATVDNALIVKGTRQRIITSDSRNMEALPDGSVHLAITSPPYFNAKMYSDAKGDLGNVHDLEKWLLEIGDVWRETYRALSPGRKFFLNIMNLPVRTGTTFRSLNLVGKSIDLCESIGFIHKRDIIWHKTNGVRAHFGTYPDPGGILINNMHESILEFEKPAKPSFRKYAHVTDKQKKESKLDKEFWLSLKNSDVWLMKPEKSGRNRDHAAPFPVELPTRLIRAYSYIGETILDPFAGSGTTLIAAAEWKRNGIGYEINKSFCDIAASRLKNMISEDGLF
ncbi:MAG: DNA methyltransferase [Hyphomicrobiales bacterium]|nr:DNA methyltransferase [Hyphomicrobiales bacterium]